MATFAVACALTLAVVQPRETVTVSPSFGISVVYGDTAGGSRGMRAAIVATDPEPLLVSVDRDGSGTFEPVEHDATLMSRSGIATELLLAGPFALVAGEPAELHLAAVDLHSNPAVPFHETVILRVLQGDVDVARTVEFPEGQGWTTVPLTPRSEGIVQLEAVARADLLRTRSNPMEVFAERPAEQIWWGDLHSYTEHSFDGVGSGVFDHARWVSGLDFHAMTDHSNGPAREGFTRGLRRNFEIYSAHGLSEAYDPSHPLAFEQSEFTNRSTSARTGVSAQDAWMRGLRLSPIAASDDHRSPDGGFRVIHDLRPNALDFTWSGRDGGFRDDAIYYLRLRQRSPVRGRDVMAWSSPVWVNAR